MTGKYTGVLEMTNEELKIDYFNLPPLLTFLNGVAMNQNNKEYYEGIFDFVLNDVFEISVCVYKDKVPVDVAYLSSCMYDEKTKEFHQGIKLPIQYNGIVKFARVDCLEFRIPRSLLRG